MPGLVLFTGENVEAKTLLHERRNLSRADSSRRRGGKISVGITKGSNFEPNSHPVDV